MGKELWTCRYISPGGAARSVGPTTYVHTWAPQGWQVKLFIMDTYVGILSKPRNLGTWNLPFDSEKRNILGGKTIKIGVLLEESTTTISGYPTGRTRITRYIATLIRELVLTEIPRRLIFIFNARHDRRTIADGYQYLERTHHSRRGFPPVKN